MKVFKFGGASVDSVSRIRNLPSILKNYDSEKSADCYFRYGENNQCTGKSSRSIFMRGNMQQALELFGYIKKQHLQIAESLGIWQTIAGFNKG